MTGRPGAVPWPNRLRWLLRVFVLLAVIGAITASGPLWRALWPPVATALRTLDHVASSRPAAAIVLYVAAYVVMTAMALPVGPVMNMAAGAVFGAWAGTLCALTGATLGSLLLFLVARGTIGRAIARRQQVLLARMRPRLERDGLLAIVALRIAPVAPAWLVTLAAAVTGLRVVPLVVGTAIGLLPTTAVLAAAGVGLGRALSGAVPPDLSLLWRPSILLPLLCLAALAALPVLARSAGRSYRAPGWWAAARQTKANANGHSS